MLGCQSIESLKLNSNRTKGFVILPHDGKITFTSSVPTDRKYLLILSEFGGDREMTR